MRWLLLGLVSVITGPALAQVEDEPPKPQVLVRPGTGPQIPFDQGRWEFWWYFNRERYLNLRPAMTSAPSNTVESDEPFAELSQSDREERLVPTLVGAVRDKNPTVRAAAVFGLAKTQDEGARPALRSLLRDADHQVRLATITAYGVFGSSFFLTALEEIIKDDDRELQERVFAAISVGLIGGSTVSESMRQLLAPSQYRDYPTQLKAALGYAVGLTRDPDNAPLIRALLGERTLTDFRVRAYLVLSLGKCGDPSDVERLIEYLGDEETQVRRSAAIALGVLCPELEDDEKGAGAAVTALLKSARKDADLMVRNFSYISLGQVGGQEGGQAAPRRPRGGDQVAPPVRRPGARHPRRPRFGPGPGAPLREGERAVVPRRAGGGDRSSPRRPRGAGVAQGVPRQPGAGVPGLRGAGARTGP